MRKIDNSAWMLAVVSGILQVLIFPTPDLYVLCWLAFAPLLVAVLRARAPETVVLPESLAEEQLLPATPLQGFLLGYVTGIIWSAGTCYWIYHVMHLYGGLSMPVAFGVLVLFCLYIGLHNAVFGALLAVIAGTRMAPGLSFNRRAALVFAPFLWVGIEFFRARITGFPWDLLGTVQVNNIPLARIATATGVYGISFEIMLVNTAFAAAFLVRCSVRRMMLAAAVMASFVLQASVLVHPPALVATETARLVQQNIPIVEQARWTSEHFRDVIVELRAKSLPPRAASEGSPGQPWPDVIVWPESPAPFFVNDPVFREAATQLARDANAYLIVGTLGVKNLPAGASPEQAQELFNSAALIAPNGRWAARYDKIHLVPFGEYVPFRALLSFARSLTAEVGNFVPGTERNVFDLGRYKAGVFICYESIFPGEVRQFAANGAGVLVNISNDGWFGESAAPWQHLNMARMRAIENNRWLIRATNTGITASIDPFGRVVETAPRNLRTALDAPFAVVTRTTFYTRHGDWFAWLCAIIAVAALAFYALQRIRHKRAAL